MFGEVFRGISTDRDHFQFRLLQSVVRVVRQSMMKETCDVSAQALDSIPYQFRDTAANRRYLRSLKETYHCARLVDDERGNNAKASLIRVFVERTQEEVYGRSEIRPESVRVDA